MRHLFLDTNFVIDYFVREDFQGDAEKLMVIEKKAKSQFFISYLTVANFAYIMRKMPVEDLKSLIRQICRNFIVISNTESQIKRALDLNASDFEDMLQYQAAADAHCDCIITRNEKDFEFSDIPVMSPSSYLNMLSLQQP
ncbi:MAG: PIN domain-containing protein [Muribaculaceae bacterium]|nr:PIN domain-containing protein [Muribaculaceae bacterium]